MVAQAPTLTPIQIQTELALVLVLLVVVMFKHHVLKVAI